MTAILTETQQATIRNAQRFATLQGGADYAYMMIQESTKAGDMGLLQMAHEMMHNINAQIDRHNDDYTHHSGQAWDTELAALVLAMDPYALGR